MILTVLEVRGFSLTAAERKRILDCRDLELLESWGRRAVTVGTVGECFDLP